MNDIFISLYEEIIRDAVDKALGNKLPFDREKIIKEYTDKMCYEVIDGIRDYITDEFFENVKDDICRKAAEVLTSMLKDALAGDDETLKNLFGFRYEYLHFRFIPYNTYNLPTQVNLINTIVKANPNIFVNEKIKQLEWELKYYKDHNKKHVEENTKLFQENMKLRSRDDKS